MLVGLSTTTILLSSHFHQGESDRAAGKKSPVVRLGTKRASQVLMGLILSTYLIVFVSTLLHILPLLASFSILASVPLANNIRKLVAKNHDKPELIRNLKFRSAKWHLAFQLSLAVGLLVGV